MEMFSKKQLLTSSSIFSPVCVYEKRRTSFLYFLAKEMK